MANKPEDLKPAGFPDDLDWTSNNILGSLSQLRDYSISEGEKANAWYLSSRVGKRLAGRSLRVAAIIFTAAAGLVPVVSQLWQTNGVPEIAPGWSPLLLGLAGLWVLLDKFLGASSAWLRYVSASQDIGDRLRKFRFDWEAKWVNLAGNKPTPDQTQELIAHCRSLVADIDKIVREETQAWVDEFRTVLKQIDLAAAKAPKTAPLGGIDIEVTNADQSAAGWTVSIDDGDEQQNSGKTASVTGIAAGIHKITVAGEIGGKVVGAEQHVNVSEGSVEAISLTLS